MNPEVFSTTNKERKPDTVNEAGGIAYSRSPEHALAQYAMTGTLNKTYYASAKTQLDTISDLIPLVSDEYLAKLALYSRTEGRMKDMPALLLAHLGGRNAGLFKAVFPKVVDNGKMLRNFCQVVRSGVTGRKSFGSMMKKQIQAWLKGRPAEQLWRDSVGNKPSISDVIKMVHPKASSKEQEALFGYLIGKPVDMARLPLVLQRYEEQKARLLNPQSANDAPVPLFGRIPFEMRTSMDLGPEGWRTTAMDASWTQTRMNLNTFLRHSVFEQPEMVRLVAERLRDPLLIRRTRCFPYQIMTAYFNLDPAIPAEIKDALVSAMEVSVESVPDIPGSLWVCPDTSASMGSPITGYRTGSTTKATCVQAGALITSVIARKNKQARILPFDTEVRHELARRVDSHLPILHNARTLDRGGGGTSVSAPLAWLNQNEMPGDAIIIISDNESWIDTGERWGWRRDACTSTLLEWDTFKSRNPNAKLVCIDLQPTRSSQVHERADILSVGGFSDTVFEVIKNFLEHGYGVDHWVERVHNTPL